MPLIIILYRVIKEAKEHDSLRISAQGSNPSFSLLCSLFTSLISARFLSSISSGFLQYEIQRPLHVSTGQYFTLEFQRELMFLRFTDLCCVWGGGVAGREEYEIADQIDLAGT